MQSHLKIWCFVLGVVIFASLVFILVEQGKINSPFFSRIGGLIIPSEVKYLDRIDTRNQPSANQRVESSKIFNSPTVSSLTTGSISKDHLKKNDDYNGFLKKESTSAIPAGFDAMGDNLETTSRRNADSITTFAPPGERGVNAGSVQSSIVDIPMKAGEAIREITIPVPQGAKVPALFFDDTPKPQAQLQALDSIASEFEKNVSEVPIGMTKEEVWDAAREFADESYIMLFGYEAFNQYHIQSAREALKEKRARSNATTP